MKNIAKRNCSGKSYNYKFQFELFLLKAIQQNMPQGVLCCSRVLGEEIGYIDVLRKILI